MKKTLRRLVWLMTALSSLLSYGQEGGEDVAADSATARPHLSALPTAYYTPETRIALEAFAYLSFQTDTAARKSNARIFAAVTQNRQVTVDLPWQVFTSGERYRIDGKVDVRKFPEYYYGLGNDTEEVQRALYTYRGVGVRNSSLKQIEGQNYVGLFTEGRWLDADSLPSFEATETPLRGAKGYRFLGAGPSFVHDSRDVILCSTQGRYFEFTATVNAAWFPKEGNGAQVYAMVNADHRRFFCVRPNTVIAYQLVARASWGDVPYRELPALGGPLLHRGYYFGRFRDRHLWCAQAEVRQKLFWRLGGVAFASAGRVHSDFSSPLWNDVRPAAGAGMRFKLSKEDEANIRFDVALTPDSHGFYVYFAEVF